MKSGTLGVCAIAAVAMLASGIARSAEPGPREAGAMQIVFVDGVSLRLNSRDLSKLDGFAAAADAANGGPAVADGIVRLPSGRLRQSPVLLSGDSATADASLAVHAALRRAQAETDAATPRRRPRPGVRCGRMPRGSGAPRHTRATAGTAGRVAVSPR